MVIRVTWEPVPKGRPRMGRGHAFTPKATRDAEEFLRTKFRAFMGKREPIPNALSVRLAFYLTKPKSVKRDRPTVKPDVDNFCKLALDAANGILWVDDAQIVHLEATKHYATGGGEAGMVLEFEDLTVP